MDSDISTRPAARAATPKHEPEPPKIVKKLQERRETQHEHGRIYRAAFVVAGVVIVLAGLAMLLLPGPAFLVIPIGLAILSLEFTWAGRLLDKALVQADHAKEKAARTSRRQKVLSGVAVAAGAAALVVAAILYDLPLLPV